MLFNCGFREDSWESLGQPGDLASLSKGNQSWILEGLMLKLKLQYFDHVMRRTDSFEKTLMLGKIEGRRRDQTLSPSFLLMSLMKEWLPSLGSFFLPLFLGSSSSCNLGLDLFFSFFFRKAKYSPSSQGYGFSSGHVWMWELDCKEIWVLNNWCFWTVVLEKTLENSLDSKEI